ncbi:Uncharacterised protein [uncultured archaeon]|nr:Uncharacterised protein [uncultured archaeon]
MYQVLYDIALRLGLGIILAAGMLILVIILQTIFYNNTKKIHLVIIGILIALIIYALGDIALDVLSI